MISGLESLTLEELQQQLDPSMLRANAVIVNPQPCCGKCLEHAKKFQTISNATVLSHEEKSSLFPQSLHRYVNNEVLLSTAEVLILEPSGRYTKCRVLLDSGSQVSFITSACAMKLNLETTKTHLHVQGIGDSIADPVGYFTRLTLRSFHDPTYNCEIKAYLVPRVTGDLPTVSFTDAMYKWPHLSVLRLADPQYNLSRRVDLLLGADAFPFIMRSEVRTGTEGQPMAQATAFGWVLLGELKVKVEVSEQQEHNAQEVKNEGGENGGGYPGKKSSRPSCIKFFGLRKHSHPGPCWP